MQQGLIFRDRIFTVSVLLPDKPGERSKVAAAIALEQGNVIKLEHNQFVSTNRSAAVELRITLESFGTEYRNRSLRRWKRRVSAQARAHQLVRSAYEVWDFCFAPALIGMHVCDFHDGLLSDDGKKETHLRRLFDCRRGGAVVQAAFLF